jgi:epoxyqueuosine reductase
MALALGFDVAGVARAEPTPETRFLRDWLDRGFAGDMAYLSRRVDERVDPRRVLDGARSVVAVGFVYDPGFSSEEQPRKAEGRAARPSEGNPRGRPEPSARVSRAQSDGWVARYAGGEDYHDVLGERLRALESGLEALAGRPVRARSYVDTGPVQERVFAAYAGLGWIGKNTCLIHPRLGSYLFLGVVLTDWELEPDVREPDHCGTCRACLDACPTDAFAAPYVLDATKCISYATIESRGPIDASLREGQGAWVFGCDICQEVCPWNLRDRRVVPTDGSGLRARLAARPEWVRPSLEWILGLGEDDWREAARNTALKRAKFRGLLRNALVAAGNSGESALVPLVRRHAEGDDPLLAEHARWALERLNP